MCGIAGILHSQANGSPFYQSAIINMLKLIRHRGPDESGVFINNHVALGNVRLSIIDIKSGQQPLSNINNSKWIVYNGEVFNYLELREILIRKGYTFKTSSDTEVVINMYLEYGEECLRMLNGQFAFAIWDTEKQELFLARDRVGIRPLFYANHKGQFLFSSEMKSFLAFPDFSFEFDYHNLSQVFTFWTTLTPNTVFKNIFEVPPGCYMKINRNGHQVKKYWSLEFPQANQNPNLDLKHYISGFEEIFYDAVRIRLRADVPVAAYLSGGIDSSVTTLFIKRIEEQILNTFSIQFEDKNFDESNYQNEVSSFLNTKHKSIVSTNESIADLFPKIIWHTEIPILRTAPVPMYSLSSLVRKNNIKVVITGEGADEILAGYNIFKEMSIRRFWAREPASQIRPILLKKLYPYIPSIASANNTMLKLFFGYQLNNTESPFYSHLLRWNNTSHIQKHLQSNIRSMNGQNENYLHYLIDRLPEGFDNYNSLSKAQWLETSIFMSGYLLSSQGDRMAMGNSVEGRYPFLDHRVIEFCNNLPSRYKLNGLEEKYLLKKTVEGKLPESVLKRSKQAYRAPISNSFFGNHSPDYIQHLLSEQNLKQTNIFNPITVNHLINKINKSNNSTELENMSLVAIISTLLLHDLFIKRKHPEFQNMEINPRIIR